jgi:hypothetical protein
MKDNMIRRPTLPKIEEDLSFLSLKNDEEIVPSSTCARRNSSVQDEIWKDIKNECEAGESDLVLLKAKTSQLNLKTRRPSYVIWKERCLTFSTVNTADNFIDIRDNCFSEEAASRIDSSLEWIRNELVRYVTYLYLWWLSLLIFDILWVVCF